MKNKLLWILIWIIFSSPITRANNCADCNDGSIFNGTTPPILLAQYEGEGEEEIFPIEEDPAKESDYSSQPNIETSQPEPIEGTSDTQPEKTESEAASSQEGTPKVEDKVTEPVKETPKVEDKVTEPVKETPKVEDKVTEPVKETPKVEDKVTKPVKEIPKVEDKVTEPVKEIPKVEDKVTEPVREIPEAEEENKVIEPVKEIPEIEDEVTEPAKETPVANTTETGKPTEETTHEDSPSMETPPEETSDVEGELTTQVKENLLNFPSVEEPLPVVEEEDVSHIYADFWAHANHEKGSSTFYLNGLKRTQNVTLHPSANSMIINNKDGSLTYSPHKEFHGVDTFSYSLTDEIDGSSSFYFVKVKVSDDYQGDNVWNFDHEQYNNHTTTAPLTINFKTGKADFFAVANPSHPSIFNLSDASEIRTLSLYASKNSQIFDNQDGTLTYISNPDFVGVDTFSYSITDHEGKTRTYSVKVKITEDYLGYDYWDFTSSKIHPEHLSVVPNSYGNNNYGFWQPGDACESVYVVNDQGISDSQFLRIDPMKHSITAVGPLHKGYDLESLEISPWNYLLYAVSGNQAPKDKRGRLYVVEPSSGELTMVGPTGFDGVVALAFKENDGSLWGWAEGKGIIEINPQTGRGTLKVPFRVAKVGGLAWTTKGNYLYASEGDKLWWWRDGDGAFMNTKCKNLPGRVEALETLPGGMLMFTVDHGKTHKLYVYDPWNCSIFEERSFVTNYSDIEGIGWTTKCQAPPVPLPKVNSWSGSIEKKDKTACSGKAQRVKIKGKITLSEPYSQAIFQSNWQIVASNKKLSETTICQGLKPPYNKQCTQPHLYSEIISDSFQFEVDAWWPGIPKGIGSETGLGMWLGINILDMQGHPLPGEMSKAIWWFNGQCNQEVQDYIPPENTNEEAK